ncbi:MAG: MBL fold metallo-hydrolase [Gemmatimonadetes bacterium]|nr:MBL fold metallo-hydrolase [Gemmatimonadota bacterium]
MNSPHPTLEFLGAAGTVTGSKHLLTLGRRRVLLDCGLFQGLKELRLRNWADPPVVLAALDGVILTHAHIDHSGYLPLLVKRGFRGPVFCTSATADLLKILLPDSGHLQEEDAERANRRGYTKHHPALPLYTRADAIRTLDFVEVRPYHERFDLDGATVRFRRAGHILGAATVEIEMAHPPLRLVYSGDLGRFGRDFLREPESVTAADVLVLESTYGDRTHPPDAEERLARIVTRTAARGGALVVPAFAVGRAQELIWMLRRLENERRVPILPVYLDSPMAIDVSEMTARYPEQLEVDPALLHDPARTPLRSGSFHLARTPEESQAINRIIGPVIIISASGMATGGRVLHHLRLRLPDPRTVVLLPGFQAAGTRGRSLQDGATQVKIHGQWVPVRATIETLDGLSAHADREDLLRWLAGFATPPRRTYLVHGEAAQAEGLSRAIKERLGWDVFVARDGETVELVSGA